MLRIAVIGGGSAGYIAAAHISKHFPHFDLYHIYDSSIPTIGVGEGTTLNLPPWLSEVTGATEPELVARCHITRKFGIKFENWGVRHAEFMQHFHPIGQYAYHISADTIIALLEEHVRATRIDAKVTHLKSDGLTVQIALANDEHLEVDFAIDATGFPTSLNTRHVELKVIPTNAACVRQGPAIDGAIVPVQVGDHRRTYQSATRAVARPHGWIFVIPLTSRTSYGYIYNRSISSLSDVRADFDEFLVAEGVTCCDREQRLTFPNFTQRRFFDGALLKIGNAASFLEPLEATAIGVILRQVQAFSYWPLRKIANLGKRVRLLEKNIDTFNAYLLKSFNQILLFVAWHYAMGSRFDSPFWRFAKANFYREIGRFEDEEILDDFEPLLDQIAQHPDPHENFEARLAESSEPTVENPIGNWGESLLAELGYGIGYFA